MVVIILDQHLGIAIKFHNALHGFQDVCRTGTASLEANMLQQLAHMREYVLYKIFLDRYNAYDNL